MRGGLFRHPGVRQVLLLLIPNALAMVGAYIGNIVDVSFTSYMQDVASLSALHNAEMLQALPAALIGQAVTQSLMPHLALQASAGRYVRMRQMAWKVIGVSILLMLPTALLLVVLGKPTIYLLFQHGAFNAHATDLTNLALIGYALALPGMAAGVLLSGAFFALKDAWTPFVTNTLNLGVRWGMLYLLFHALPASMQVLAVPLALAIAVNSEAILLGLLLLFRLRRRIKLDRGMVRLLLRRQYQRRGATNSVVDIVAEQPVEGV